MHLGRLGVLVGFANVVSGSLWDLRGDARGANLGPENVFRTYLPPKNLINRREHNFPFQILEKHLDEIPCCFAFAVSSVADARCGIDYLSKDSELGSQGSCFFSGSAAVGVSPLECTTSEI